jgi:glutamate racemase
VPSAPIGVYDSGFGGLGVLAELRRVLPARDFVYLGDSGRAPYGGRDAEVILDLSEQCVERLFEEGCHLVVVACHTVSCVALRHLQGRYNGDAHRVLGVTIPAAEQAVASGARHLGLLGTRRTVDSGTFAAEVRKLDPSIAVTSIAAPLLAPIVEEGLDGSEIARLAVERYLARLGRVDALVLGCTHYPLLRRELDAAVAPGTLILDPSGFVAERVVDWLCRHPAFDGEGRGGLRVLSTGDPTEFSAHGTRFSGETLPSVEHVAELAGRLVQAPRSRTREGQVRRRS